VEDIQENKRLLLRAEMRLPGKGWLEFGIRAEGAKRLLSVTPYFDTHTLLGKAYWLMCLPLHHFILQSYSGNREKELIMAVIKVFLCDDHTLFRQGMRKMLESEKDMKVVGEASNGHEMLEGVDKTLPDVILTGINMPGMDGLSATRSIRKKYPRTNVIILTAFDDEAYVFQAIKAGAIGYLLKDVLIGDVLDAIRSAYKDEALIQPVIASKVLKEFVMLGKGRGMSPDNRHGYMTAREEEILRFLAMGDTNKAIAQKLGIAEKTVKNHISNIFSVLHVKNRTQAALYALGKK
jgi:DNA-binding NarL/FixJ family response regulator